MVTRVAGLNLCRATAKIGMTDLEAGYGRGHLLCSVGAAMIGGWIIDGTEIEIDPSKLEPGTPWTARDFNPHANTGFQRQVT
jgi:hypothetical protein